jgi:hypothetical protein
MGWLCVRLEVVVLVMVVATPETAVVSTLRVDVTALGEERSEGVVAAMAMPLSHNEPSKVAVVPPSKCINLRRCMLPLILD